MRRAIQVEQTRKKIMDSALVLFGTQGYEHTSMNEISSYAKLSKGILYHYFSCKDELYLDCVQACFDQMVTYLQTHPVEPGTPKEQIEAFIQLRHLFFQEYPLYEGVFYESLLGRPIHLRPELQRLRQGLEQVNLDFCQKISQTILTVNHPSQPNLSLFFSIILNGFWLQLQQRDSILTHKDLVPEQEQVISQMLEIFFRGLEQTACD